ARLRSGDSGSRFAAGRRHLGVAALAREPPAVADFNSDERGAGGGTSARARYGGGRFRSETVFFYRTFGAGAGVVATGRARERQRLWDRGPGGESGGAFGAARRTAA